MTHQIYKWLCQYMSIMSCKSNFNMCFVSGTRGEYVLHGTENDSWSGWHFGSVQMTSGFSLSWEIIGNPGLGRKVPQINHDKSSCDDARKPDSAHCLNWHVSSVLILTVSHLSCHWNTCIHKCPINIMGKDLWSLSTETGSLAAQIPQTIADPYCTLNSSWQPPKHLKQKTYIIYHYFSIF